MSSRIQHVAVDQGTAGGTDVVLVDAAENERVLVYGYTLTVDAGGTLKWQSGGIDEVVEVSIVAEGGTLALTFAADATAAIDFDAESAAIVSALEATDGIDSSEVEVEVGDGVGSVADPIVWTLTFVGGLGRQNVGAVTVDDALLTGDDAEATVSVAVAGAAAVDESGVMPVTTAMWIQASSMIPILATEPGHGLKLVTATSKAKGHVWYQTEEI